MAIRLANINRISQHGRVGFRVVPVVAPAGSLAWTTPPGSLGTVDEGSEIAIQIGVTDPDDNIANWSITAGSLPLGIGLNPFTGTLVGTVEPVTADTTATFTLRVEDQDGNNLTGVFSLTVRDVPSVVWITPAGTIAETGDTADFEAQLEARPT